jgi:hypothetical protein
MWVLLWGKRDNGDVRRVLAARPYTRRTSLTPAQEGTITVLSRIVVSCRCQGGSSNRVLDQIMANFPLLRH